MKIIRVGFILLLGSIALCGLILVVGGSVELLVDPTISNPAYVGGLGIWIVLTVLTTVLTFKLAAPFWKRSRPVGPGFPIRPCNLTPTVIEAGSPAQLQRQMCHQLDGDEGEPAEPPGRPPGAARPVDGTSLG